jgi:hypothetical protein
MPVRTQGLDNNLCDGAFALTALCAVSIGMTAYAPRVAILLDEGGCRIKRLRGNQQQPTIQNVLPARTYVTALCAEEVADVPFCSTSNNYLAFDGRLTALTTRAEELMEV